MGEQEKQGMSTGLGVAIAGVVIAVAIFVTGFDASSSNEQVVTAAKTANKSFISSVQADDHIYGDPEAPITFIEYSDFECPFCGRFHPTMKQVVDENPDVKWVYRHFPLSSHPNAFPSAVASECVANLGSRKLFWDFSDLMFENLGGKQDRDLYMQFAKDNGIDELEFSACLDEDRYADKVEDDLLEGQLSGASGTPFSVLSTESGETIPFSGALPLETIETLINKIRNN